MKRDPRVDPKPGDVLIYGPQWQSERTEVLSADGKHVTHTVGASAFPVPIHKWREWMRSAEVLHAAD